MPTEAYIIGGVVLLVAVLVLLLRLQQPSDDARYRITPEEAQPPAEAPPPRAATFRQTALARRPAPEPEPLPRWDEPPPRWDEPPPRSYRGDGPQGPYPMSVAEALAGMRMGYSLERHEREWPAQWWLLPPARASGANSFHIADHLANELIAHPKVRDISVQSGQAPGTVFIYIEQPAQPTPADTPPVRALPERRRLLSNKDSRSR